MTNYTSVLIYLYTQYLDCRSGCIAQSEGQACPGVCVSRSEHTCFFVSNCSTKFMFCSRGDVKGFVGLILAVTIILTTMIVE